MLQGLFSDIVNVRRRPSNPTRDVLNNPNYGDPTTWPYAYQNIHVRLAWSGKSMKISSTGELIFQQGTLYFSKDLDLRPEDRIITVASDGVTKGIEYMITTTYPSYYMNGKVDHFEGNVVLPIA